MESQTFGPTGPNPVAEEQFRRGFELARQGEIDEAILAVEAAIAVSQDDSRYHDLLGSLYARKGLFEMALAEWKRSIECDPDHAEVFRRIETAEKMRVQNQSGGNRWNFLGLALLSFFVVVSVSAAVLSYRSKSADRTLIESLRTEVAQARQGMVEQAKFDSILTEKNNLEAQVNESAKTLVELKKENDQLKTGTVSQGDLQHEQELRNRVQSELAAARKTIDTMKAQLDAIGSASGIQNLTSQIAQKSQEIDTLNRNYKTLNDERKRLEDELNKARADLVSTRNNAADLEAAAVNMVTATEATRLKSEITALTSQVAQLKGSGSAPSAPGTPQVDSKEVLFLLNGALEAVRFAAAGKPDDARAALRKVQDKAPKDAAIADTLKSLGAEPSPRPEPPAPTATPKPSEPKAEPTPRPEAKPTPKTSEKKKPKPTPEPRKKAEPKPEPEPEPEKAPAPTALPKPPDTVPVASGESSVARPVKVRRLDSNSSKVEEKKPAARPAPDNRKKDLYQRKKQLTEQALGLYRKKQFDGAERLINQAYQIDPDDPAVNQLRNAIRKAQKG